LKCHGSENAITTTAIWLWWVNEREAIREDRIPLLEEDRVSALGHTIRASHERE
jgi:hypothetical protein